MHFIEHKNLSEQKTPQTLHFYFCSKKIILIKKNNQKIKWIISFFVFCFIRTIKKIETFQKKPKRLGKRKKRFQTDPKPKTSSKNQKIKTNKHTQEKKSNKTIQTKQYIAI